MAIDISAVGAKVVITLPEGSPITITQFSDEGTPFESGDVEVSTNAKNLNGQMISSRTPAVYPVSVTVIPGSDDDIMLQSLLQKSSIQPGSVTPISKITIISLSITIPGINASAERNATGPKYVWSQGRIKSGPTGPSTGSEGRLSARTYTFEFEKFQPVSGTGLNIENP